MNSTFSFVSGIAIRTTKIGLISVLFSFCILVSHQPVNAQEVHGEPDVWFLLITHYKINDQWSIGNELHMRYDDYLHDKQQLLIRPFLDFHAGQSVTFTAGYTFINTYPYGEYPVEATKPEHNIWEQVTLKQTAGRFVIWHRYRLEQRWIGNLLLQPDDNSYEVNGYQGSNRFRYRITLRHPITEKLFVNVFDELWIRGSKDFGDIEFDRNWFYAGLGYQVKDNISLQMGYMHQYIMNNPERFERHPTLAVTGEIAF